MQTAIVTPAKLSPDEAQHLAALLRRAIAHNQLNLHVASPYENDEDWRRDGWEFNDMHNGNAANSCSWNVDVCDDVPNDFPDGEEGDDTETRSEVQIYVDDDSLAYLAASMTGDGLNRALNVAREALAAQNKV